MVPALLVIDVQQWFFKISVFSTPDGESKLRQLIDNTNKMIEFFKERNLPIIHILNVHKPDGSTRDLWAKRNDSWVLIEGTEDAEELSDIHNYDTDIIINKTRTNSFLRTNLEDTLRRLNIDTVVVTGYSTNKCVGMTAIGACERDFDVILVQDAILGPQQEKADAMLRILKTYGIEPMSSSDVMNILSKCYKLCL